MNLNTDNTKVSLIIPVYNVEAYLRKSLDSAVNQTLDDFEIIAVNDGSTDSSYEILKEYENKYDNFRVINQKNGGLSAAKNAGIKIAKGEYIAFLDSDDYLDKNFLETLYNMAVNNNAEIACCNFKFYFPKSDIKIRMPILSKGGVYSKRRALKELILDCTMHHFSWNKLCKRSIFEENNIQFYNMYFEDISTSPRLFYSANKVAITSKPLYYYTQRPGSILKTMNAEKINDYIKSMGIIRNYLEEKNDYKVYRSVFRIYAFRTRLINYFSIIKMHLQLKNFSGLANNIKINNKLINFYIDDNYKVRQDLIEMPYLIMPPVKKVRRKAKNYN